MAIGRNEPCPCGSGKKYKRCCLRREKGYPVSGVGDHFTNDTQDIFDGKGFASIEEAQAEVDQLLARKNDAPVDEFSGLSPNQMYDILNSPFDCPEIAKFSDDLPQDLSAPFIHLFSMLVEAITKDGLKPTATGNLPPKFCKATALSYWGEKRYEFETRIRSIRTEQDFYDLHCLRVVAEICGVVRKYKGKYIIGTKFRKILAEQGPTALYLLLFKTYVTEFNWGYGDRYSDDVVLVQQSFLFTLFLLSKYGDVERPETFYQDQFIKAFPDAINEVEENEYFPAEQTIRNIYYYRTLSRCFSYFGLVEIDSEKEGKMLGPKTVRRLPLLDKLVKFYV